MGTLFNFVGIIENLGKVKIKMEESDLEIFNDVDDAAKYAKSTMFKVES